MRTRCGAREDANIGGAGGAGWEDRGWQLSARSDRGNQSRFEYRRECTYKRCFVAAPLTSLSLPSVCFSLSLSLSLSLSSSSSPSLPRAILCHSTLADAPSLFLPGVTLFLSFCIYVSAQ